MPIRGLPQLKSRLMQIARVAPLALGAALFEEAEIEATESRRRTPVEFGALRDSTHVTRPEVSSGSVEVTIGVGGPAAPYAIYVHENLENFHPVGQAKFLESTILESRPFMLRRLARRLGLRDLVGG